MERVGHHDPVEVVQAEWLAEVGDALVEPGRGEPLVEDPPLVGQRRRIAIDRDDPTGGPEEIGQGERERTAARAKIRPGRPGAGDPFPDQPDMIGMVHLTMVESAEPGVLRPAGVALTPDPKGRVDSIPTKSVGIRGSRPEHATPSSMAAAPSPSRRRASTAFG